MPAATRGHPNVVMPRSQPDRSGAAADARLLGTEVTLAAAGRSSGCTNAITYDERVGTSICESKLRRTRRANAHQMLGANGTRARNRFEGRCVNTMVFTSPKRWASGTAAK